MTRLRLVAVVMMALFVAVPCHAQLVIDSLDGDVTQNEVDTFISVVAATPIPTSQWSATVTHNYLADGTGGATLEGINDLYAITGDIAGLTAQHSRLLSLAIQWTDAWLIYRNDMPLGEQRVMWTGNVEPVWPPNCPTCSSPTYYESEVGDTVGHLAYTTYNILSTPSIWGDTVTDRDPNGLGATYLDRAQTYLAMLEYTMNSAFTPHFIDTNTLMIARPSTSTGYLSSFHNVNAWNVQFMLLNAYWRLAQCHVILGDNPGLAAMYGSIVQNSTDMFVQNAVPGTAPDGSAVYDWGYGNFGDVRGRLTGEQIGVHGQYDMWGLTRAYRTGYTGATAQQMQTYADTVVHEMTLRIDPDTGGATYAGYNNRCCSTQTYDYLPDGFIFLTPYNTDIYRPAANADISSGRQKNSPGLTAGILWAKHWIFAQSSPNPAPSEWVFYGPDGRLQYQADDLGNQIMDFSYAGYEAGGVALPDLPVRRTVSPSGGDDTDGIQAAIDSISALMPDANGFRGAVLLAPGTYTVSSTLQIDAGGVVVRGSGSGTDGTIISMDPNAAPFLLFSVKGSGSYETTGVSAFMTDAYVQSGALSFNVDDPSLFAVGDAVLVKRPVTQAWVALMGMDHLAGSDGTPQTWLSIGSIITTDRAITAISGNQITLDAPLSDSFDATYLSPTDGSVERFTFAGRVSQVGVEHLSVIAPAVDVDINHPQFTGLSMSAVINGWAQDLVFQDTQNTVTISGNVKQVTLDNIHVNHTVVHTGDRMTDFGVSGTQVLVNKSSSDGTGEWPYVTQGRSTGPNVLLNFRSTQQAGVSAHQRWATGLLTDNGTLPNAPNGVNGGTTGISFSDRGNHGSGQGWAMGWGVAWNVTTPFLVVEMPPGSANWCIGCVGAEESATEPGSGKPIPNGFYDSLGALVTPASLYLAQLCDRLGPQAPDAIGYSGACQANPSTVTRR
jgi:hypothetical protein